MAVLITPIWIADGLRNSAGKLEAKFLIELKRYTVLAQYHVELHGCKSEAFRYFKGGIYKQGADALAAMSVFDHVGCIRNMTASASKVWLEIKTAYNFFSLGAAYINF